MRLRTSGKLALVGVLLVAACGEPVDAANDTQAPSTTVVEGAVTESSTTTTSIDRLTTTTTVGDVSTTSGSSPAATRPAPQPNRPPVIEDPGVTLSIAPEDTAFTLRIDPVASDPDGDGLTYIVVTDLIDVASFDSAFEAELSIGSVLFERGVELVLIADDGELESSVEVGVDLSALEVVGYVEKVTLQATNPGRCFFALGPGGSTTVPRDVHVRLQLPEGAGGGVYFDETVTLTSENPSIDLLGFSTRVWPWSPGEILTSDSFRGIYRLFGIDTTLNHDVRYENSSATGFDHFSIHLCDLTVSYKSDFNLLLDP